MPVFHSNWLPPPHLEGGNKLPAKVFDSNFLLLDCRLGRVPWQTRMASGWRGYVWGSPKKKKKWCFEIQQEYIWRNAHTHTHTHMLLYVLSTSSHLLYIWTMRCPRCICLQTLFQQSVLSHNWFYMFKYFKLSDACRRAKVPVAHYLETVLDGTLYMSSATHKLWYFSDSSCKERINLC
jgi:hypothetical protein